MFFNYSLTGFNHTPYIKIQYMLGQEILDNYASCIFDAKYDQIDTANVAIYQKDLTPSQCHDFHTP